MRVDNNITEPGGIRKVSLRTDSVMILTYDGRKMVYELKSNTLLADAPHRTVPVDNAVNRSNGGDHATIEPDVELGAPDSLGIVDQG